MILPFLAFLFLGNASQASTDFAMTAGLEVLLAPTCEPATQECGSGESLPVGKENICQLSHLGPLPIFEKPPSSIFGIRPYSKRALAFAQHYQKISEQLHPYLGSPKVITSLAFESHVVKDVSSNFVQLETAIDMAKQLRKVGKADPVAAVIFLKDLLKVLNSKEMLFATARVGLLPFLELPVSKWGWHNLDKIIEDLTGIYEGMAAMNMHIFSYMSSPKVSPLNVYFRMIKQCNADFDGYLNFPDDKNGILREAFHKFFLLSKSTNIEERKQLSYEFSILLIAHEQIYAQTYYDRIKNQHEKLAGLFKVNDPMGTYHLINKNWADFAVRFSLANNKPVQELTAEDILNSSADKGTIPGYYKSRIMGGPKSLRLLVSPAFPKSVEEEKAVTKDAKILIEEHGCVGCHNFTKNSAAEMVGPDLSRVGSVLTAAQIRNTILNPNSMSSARCAGKTCPLDIMPQDFSETLKPDELNILVDYLSEQK